jgi:Spy/CpxP family protein refolding chaperone
MVRHLRWIVIGTIVGVLGVAGALYAQQAGPEQGRGGFGGRGLGGPGFGGPGGRGGGLPFAALNLTDAQREQVRQVMQQHRTQMQAVFERHRAAEIARNQAVETVPVDEGRIRAAMQELAAIETDLAIAQARAHADVYNLLTPEQQGQAQKLRADREARLKERQDRLQQRLQNRPSRRPQA